jgi:toxin secretion/phage lysis holin
MCKTVFSPIAVVAFAGYLLFTLLDIATGLIKAFYLGDFQSAEMRKGLWKKTGTLCMVCVVIMLEAILCMLKFPGVPRYLTAIVSSWYMSMEVGSIIENLGVMGVPVPKILRRAIKAIKDKGDDMKSSEGENQHEEDNMH